MPGIEDLADFEIPLRLSISCTEPNDELRSAHAHQPEVPLGRLVERCAAAARERITIEHAMIVGVNDAPQMAYEMAALLDPAWTTSNLIPLQPHPHAAGPSPLSEGRVKTFCATLSELHLESSRSEGAQRESLAAWQLAAVKAQGTCPLTTVAPRDRRWPERRKGASRSAKNFCGVSTGGRHLA